MRPSSVWTTDIRWPYPSVNFKMSFGFNSLLSKFKSQPQINIWTFLLKFWLIDGKHSTKLGADKPAENTRNAPKQFGLHDFIFYAYWFQLLTSSAFQLSLAVLVRYRSRGHIYILQKIFAWFAQVIYLFSDHYILNILRISFLFFKHLL